MKYTMAIKKEHIEQCRTLLGGKPTTTENVGFDFAVTVIYLSPEEVAVLRLAIPAEDFTLLPGY